MICQYVQRSLSDLESLDLDPCLEDPPDLLSPVGERTHDHAPIQEVDGDPMRTHDSLSTRVGRSGLVFRSPNRAQSTVSREDDVGGDGRLEGAVEIGEGLDVEHVDLGSHDS